MERMVAKKVTETILAVIRGLGKGKGVANGWWDRLDA